MRMLGRRRNRSVLAELQSFQVCCGSPLYINRHRRRVRARQYPQWSRGHHCSTGELLTCVEVSTETRSNGFLVGNSVRQSFLHRIAFVRSNQHSLASVPLLEAAAATEAEVSLILQHDLSTAAVAPWPVCNSARPAAGFSQKLLQ